jgi:hypothetical protein
MNSRNGPGKLKGLAMIELTLTIGMLLASIAIIADLYSINRLRGNFDRMSHNLASILSVQSYLTAKDLESLLEVAIPEAKIGRYELNIYKVNLDRSMDWRPLHRGALTGICSSLTSGQQFTAEMPEEDEDDDSVSFIVIQLCRESDGLTPMSSLMDHKVVEVRAYNRMQYHDMAVDDELADELSIEDNQSE